MRRFLNPLLLIVSIAVLLIATQYMGRLSSVDGIQELTLMPVLSPPPGIYQNSISIRMQPSHPQGKIVFTTDGSQPSADNGTLYAQPIRIDGRYAKVSTIRAIEITKEHASPILTASYAVGLSDQVPLVILTAPASALWDAESGLLVNSARRGLEWERAVQFSMFGQEAVYGPSQPIGIRIIGDPLIEKEKLDFRLYFRSEYGNPRLDFNPFSEPNGQGNQNTYKRLLLQSTRDNDSVNFIRDQLAAKILINAGMPAVRGRIVHLFINDSSWGLYRLTERIDNEYLREVFDISVADIVQEGNAREGTDEVWDSLLSWVIDNDMDKDASYSYIDSHIDLNNFMTVSCIQRYFQLPPDAFYAIYPEQDKWFWIFEGGGTQQSNTSDFDTLYQQLMKNQIFRFRYATQCNDLLNTALSEQQITENYMAYSQGLADVFTFEQARWPNTPPWNLIHSQQLDDLKQRVHRLRSEIDDELGNPGIAALHIHSQPKYTGDIYINGTSHVCSDNTGDCSSLFFINTELVLQPVPLPGYVFLGWQCDFACDNDLKEDKSLFLKITSENTVIAQFGVAGSEDNVTAPDDAHINEYWINDNGTRYASLGYRPIYGDWIELLVEKRGALDMRGWRITDNNTIGSIDEGSIILPDIDALASVPRGTVILLLTSENKQNDQNFPVDDTYARDKQMIFYIGNQNLDISTDPGFHIDPNNDNVVLLSPGHTADFVDDIVVDFIAEGSAVTAYSFGALHDGVTFTDGFSRLGNDDGALLAVRGRNDRAENWIVDPDSCLSGDSLCSNPRNIVTPGRLNPAQEIFW